MNDSKQIIDIDISDIQNQSNLYQQYIIPNEQLFLDVVREIRATVDMLLFDAQAWHWYNDPYITHEQVRMRDTSNMFRYPDENCALIVNFFRMIFEDIVKKWEHIYFQEFIEAGGKFHHSWGTYTTQKGKQYLQNFFQIGDRILDVAYEEMNPEMDTPIHIEKIQEARYKNIQTLDEWIEAFESYYEWHICYSSLDLLWWFAYFHPFIINHIPSGYLMRMQYEPSISKTDIIPYLKNDTPIKIPEKFSEDILSIVAMMLAFDTFNVNEIYLLKHIHDTIMNNWIVDMREEVDTMKSEIDELAKLQNISSDELFVQYAEDIDYLMWLIYDRQYDLNYFRRTGKVFWKYS